MKKIININLSGRVIPIEDTAYDSLQRYIESLRRYFANEEGRDEIINDIESRIAELMNDKIKKGAAVVTEGDINEIINVMGRVEDFEAVEGEPATASATASGARSSTNTTGTGSYSYQQQETRQRFTGRLYRDADDKIIGGVCAGIANYVNVDPAIVRLLFAIITFGGFGFGFLLYILLWIVLPAKTLNTYIGKRFFRNPDDRVIGGVAGGLAAYFKANPWTIRAIFAAPLALNILFGILNGIFSPFGHDFFPNFFFGSFTGTFILAYIILWIVMPEAKTPYDKMEMRGETVDVNRIRQNVQEGMENFGTRAKAWGEEVKASAQSLGARASEFANTRGRAFAQEASTVVRPAASGFGHAVGVLFKAFFLFVAGVIAFSLFVAVLVFTFSGIAQPINAFLIDGIWQRVFMWGTIILFLAVPLIGIITWIIRRVMNVRSQNRYLGWIFGGLWTLGWISLALFVSSMVKDFRFTDQTESEIQLARPAMNKMVVKVPGNPIRYSGNYGWMDIDPDDGWDVTDDSLLLSNIRISVQKSPDSFYHVTLHRYSRGSNRGRALDRAESIQYSVQSMDSVLALGSGFGLSRDDKFRGQKVMVEISIPVGRQIRFDQSVSEKLNPFNIRVSENERNNRRRNWNRRDWDIDWDNNRYYDWEPDTDYYMTADGELREVGMPVLNQPATPEQRTDTVRTEQTYRMVLPLEHKEALNEVQTKQTVKKRDMGGDVPTPMPMPFVPTIF
ncbi:MAG TPA: PspC domain-containing protein [Flavisolibacter sp.]|jgi:phage shock protein PspC (stress-responsive transcriptional regulator)|nr:PspC domain-containing protein [Flavisolibacter sp.]